MPVIGGKVDKSGLCLRIALNAVKIPFDTWGLIQALTIALR